MSDYVPRALRERIAEQARHRCGYCLTSEVLAGIPSEIEHIIPLAAGGRTIESNLWLACSPCNEYKGVRITAIDPISGEIVPVFNPRQQAWSDHFAWSTDCIRIIGRTPVGRATIVALHLNRP